MYIFITICKDNITVNYIFVIKYTIFTKKYDYASVIQCNIVVIAWITITATAKEETSKKNSLRTKQPNENKTYGNKI